MTIKMTDEAAKVINLSLCKMAESRTIRRGGTSLHKHLLIASVLTKARSVYIENLYLGDSECLSPSTSTLTPLPSICTFSGQNSSIFDNTDSSSLDEDSDITSAEMIDPSFFVEVEGDIELPSDILSCVEKLTQISGEEIRFMNAEQVSSCGSSNLAQNANEMILSNLSNIVCSSSGHESSYSNLDSDINDFSTNCTISNHHVSSALTLLAGPITKLKSIKRRRTWSLEEQDEVDVAETSQDLDDEGYSEEKSGFEQFLPQNLNDKLRKNGISVTKNATNKRRRLSKSEKSEYFSSNNSSSSNSNSDNLTLSSVEENKENESSRFSSYNFRTKSAQFEVDEIEESEEDDDDSFLHDDFEQAWSDANGENVNGNTKNDRRVPSASSGSGSDEEAESLTAMDVDQITSLVKYFTFTQQQHNNNSSSPSCPPSSPTFSNKSLTQSDTSTCISGGLTRSMSTPDLCSVHKSRELNTSSSSSLASSKNSSSDHHHVFGTSFSHRVLPVKV